MLQCWNWKAKNRPDFDELVGFFEHNLQSVSEVSLCRLNAVCLCCTQRHNWTLRNVFF